MDKKQIADRLRYIITAQLCLEDHEVKPERRIIEDLGADALDIVELVMEIEDTFDVEIKDEDVENIKTVQDAVNYITDHLPAEERT